MILVTGATGFVGSELILQLIRKGEKVRALRRETSLVPNILLNLPEIDWKIADVLDYFQLLDAMEGITKIYHCAAMVSFDTADKKQMMQVNVQGTINLLNACNEFPIEKLVHVSSVAAVGDGKLEDLITEKNHWEFNGKQSAYSVSKYRSEMEVFRACAEGLNAVIVNPGIIIGKNAGTQGSGKLFETVRKGLKYYPGGGFGYIDVEDVVKAMILLMESNISGERFILTSENLSYKEFFSRAAHELGVKAPSVALQPWMLKMAYLSARIISPLTGRKFNLTPDTIRSAFKKRRFSNDKVRNALQIEFKPLQQSLTEICKSE